jgi:hypothetical protein
MRQNVGYPYRESVGINVAQDKVKEISILLIEIYIALLCHSTQIERPF